MGRSKNKTKRKLPKPQQLIQNLIHQPNPLLDELNVEQVDDTPMLDAAEQQLDDDQEPLHSWNDVNAQHHKGGRGPREPLAHGVVGLLSCRPPDEAPCDSQNAQFEALPNTIQRKCGLPGVGWRALDREDGGVARTWPVQEGPKLRVSNGRPTSPRTCWNHLHRQQDGATRQLPMEDTTDLSRLHREACLGVASGTHRSCRCCWSLN